MNGKKFYEIDKLRKKIIDYYEENFIFSEAYSNFIEIDSVYFAMILKVFYPEGIYMIDNRKRIIALNIEGMLINIKGLQIKDNYSEICKKDIPQIDEKFFPTCSKERLNKNNQYAMLINTVIDRYYPNMQDRKVLPEELEDYLFEDLRNIKEK